MNKSAKSPNKSPNKSKSAKSPNKSPNKSKSSKSYNKANAEDTEAARVAEVAWGMAYMNEVWKKAYEKAGDEIKANMNR